MSTVETTLAVDEESVERAYADNWWMFLIAGILWLFFGFFVLSLRPGSIAAVVILISIGFFLGALTQFVLAAVSSGGWRVLGIIGGVLARSRQGSLHWCGRSPRSSSSRSSSPGTC